MHDVDLTPDIYFAAEITKVEDQPDGSVMVYGCPANPETLDNDDQIADADWLQEALPAWFHSYGNVREMHQPSAVGTAKTLEWDNGKPQIAAKIVDPIAAKKVREGVYKAFSIGVKKPEIVYDRKAPGGRIKGGKIVEVSTVDRPSIPGSDIESFKAAVRDGFMLCKAVGVNEWFDTQMGVVIADDTIDRTTDGGDMTEKADTADLEKRDFDRNVGGGVDRDKIPAEDFAGKDRTFPIVTPGDVSDAARSIGQAGDDNYSADKLKENITRIARRKGSTFVAELPQAWKDEDKAATPDDGKTVEAPIDSSKEAESDMNEETVKAADAEKTDVEKDDAIDEVAASDSDKSVAPDESKTALEQLEKALADKTWCAQCGSMQKIEGGATEKVGNVEMLVGKDGAGHELRKVLSTKAADGDAEKSDDADKTADADKAADVEKTDAVEKDAGDGDGKDKPFGDANGPDNGDGDGDGDKTVDADASKTLEAAVDKIDDNAVKSALVELFKDAGIDLGKIGRKMATKRLDRFNAAIDELKSLASELANGVMPDGEKAADVGGPVQVDANTAIAETRFVDALRLVNALARELRPGDGTFDLDAEGKDGHDMGVADALSIRDRIDTNNGKAVDADLTKAEILSEATKLVGPELAKSVAAQLEKAFEPLVQRLEKVEHTVVPANGPVLREADRRHVLDGDLEKRERSEEALKADLEKRLAGMPDSEREELLATMLASARGWR